MTEISTYVMPEHEARRLTERIRQAAREVNVASALARRADRSEKRKPSFLYLMQMGENGPVKIGVAVDVEARRRTLSTAAPWPIRVLYALPNMAHREREMHDRLRHHRLNGEWFEPIPEIFDWFRMEAI